MPIQELPGALFQNKIAEWNSALYFIPQFYFEKLPWAMIYVSME